MAKRQQSKTKKAIEPIPVEEYEYVHCRSFGHRWRIDRINTEGYFYELWLRCDECTMVRHDKVHPVTGSVDPGRSYQQPPRYKNPDHSDRSEYRRELIRRALREAQEIGAVPSPHSLDTETTTV